MEEHPGHRAGGRSGGLRGLCLHGVYDCAAVYSDHIPVCQQQLLPSWHHKLFRFHVGHVRFQLSGFCVSIHSEVQNHHGRSYSDGGSVLFTGTARRHGFGQRGQRYGRCGNHGHQHQSLRGRADRQHHRQNPSRPDFGYRGGQLREDCGLRHHPIPPLWPQHREEYGHGHSGRYGSCRCRGGCTQFTG